MRPYRYKLSVYIRNTEAAKCHVVVVKLRMELIERKGECTNKIRSIFYTMMLLLGFSICFILRLLFLCCLQPGEPLVDLTEGGNKEEKHAKNVCT